MIQPPKRPLLTDEEAWRFADKRDWWVFDKLILSRALRYVCGPAGYDVPRIGHYIVRPCVNTRGMGLGAYVTKLTGKTDHLPPGSFWCEYFSGNHYSHDFVDGKHAVCYHGVKDKEDETRFSHWFKSHRTEPPLPDFIADLIARYRNVNIECIEDRIIEVHLRASPDWHNYNADELIPVHSSAVAYAQENNMHFVFDPAADRVGFFVKGALTS